MLLILTLMVSRFDNHYRFGKRQEIERGIIYFEYELFTVVQS